MDVFEHEHADAFEREHDETPKPAPIITPMTPRQIALSEKYLLQNYVTNLKPGHRNTPEEIMMLEVATRGQNQNPLWKLLRINRTTASRGGHVYGCDNPAMNYGLHNEDVIKCNDVYMDGVCEAVEARLNSPVVKRVLNCGLFLSPMGVFSASPDGYFVLANGDLVVLEIKCPYTYRNLSLDEVRQGFNRNKSRYRVPNTAFSVNRTGEMLVAVETKNDHYRQMQSQLYVTNAVLAVYFVKFADMPEVHFVERDEAVIAELGRRERLDFEQYVAENKKGQQLVAEKARLETFVGSMRPDLARMMARQGLYYDYGDIRCHFCRRHFEVRGGGSEEASYEHECDKTGNVGHVHARHVGYLNVSARTESLLRTGRFSESHCQQLAERGLFHEDTSDSVRFYCCGNTEEEGHALNTEWDCCL